MTTVDELKQTRQIQLAMAGVVAIAEMIHLGWEYAQGEIKSHHLLNRMDLPSLSNAWGLVLLPVLTWVLLGRLKQRFTTEAISPERARRATGHAVAGFIGALLYAVAISTAFTQHLDDMAATLFLGLFVLAILLPVHRPEMILGFVLGMTFTFGAILPTLIAGVLATLSIVVHFVFQRALRLIRPKTANETLN